MEITMSDLYQRYLETDLLREKIINIIKDQPMSVPGVCKLMELDNTKMNWIFSRLVTSGHIIKIREKKMCPVMNKKFFIMEWTGLEFNPKSLDDIHEFLCEKSSNMYNARMKETNNAKSEVINHPNGRVIRLLDRKADWNNPKSKHKTSVNIGSSFYLMDYA